MKKLVVFAALVMGAVAAQASVQWNWWLENESASADVSLGIASRCKAVSAFELSLFYSSSPVADGVQWTFLGLNDSEATCPLQLAFVNRGKDPCVQFGFANINDSSVFDMGLVNCSDEAKFQLGFLNFNKKGFLPVFIFINFDPSIFK